MTAHDLPVDLVATPRAVIERGAPVPAAPRDPLGSPAAAPDPRDPDPGADGVRMSVERQAARPTSTPSRGAPPDRLRHRLSPSSSRAAGSTCLPPPRRTARIPTATPTPSGCGSTGGSTVTRSTSSARGSTTSRWARAPRSSSCMASPAPGRTPSRTSPTSRAPTGLSRSTFPGFGASPMPPGRSRSRPTGASSGILRAARHRSLLAGRQLDGRIHRDGGGDHRARAGR